jgi:hypothetical protein
MGSQRSASYKTIENLLFWWSWKIATIRLALKMASMISDYWPLGNVIDDVICLFPEWVRYMYWQNYATVWCWSSLKWPQWSLTTYHRWRHGWWHVPSIPRDVLLLLAFLEGHRALLPPGGTLLPFYFPGGALPFKKIIIINLKKSFLLVVYDTSSIWEPPKVS